MTRDTAESTARSYLGEARLTATGVSGGLVTAPTANVGLAARARQLAESHPPRTPERRAAAAAYVALTTTKSTDAARRALATFASPAVRAAAAAILDDLERTP